MNKTRLENLTDWVFAIVLTLLVLEFHIPEHSSHDALIQSLYDMIPTLFAYVLVCGTLTTYWLIHHYLITIFAKHISRGLVMANIVFLVFMSLLPISASLLGSYIHEPISIYIYGVNILLITSSLIWMRSIIYAHPETDLSSVSPSDSRYGKIRVFLPIWATLLAIFLAHFSPIVSFGIIIFTTVISVIPGGIAKFDRYVLRYFWGKRKDKKEDA